MKFDVESTAGAESFTLLVHEDWAPIGAARFKELVEANFYDDTRFFRVIPSFMVQFGLSGNPATGAEWRAKTMKDEGVKRSNKPGYITFAKSGAPNSRTTQLVHTQSPHDAPNRFPAPLLPCPSVGLPPP